MLVDYGKVITNAIIIVAILVQYRQPNCLVSASRPWNFNTLPLRIAVITSDQSQPAASANLPLLLGLIFKRTNIAKLVSLSDTPTQQIHFDILKFKIGSILICRDT